MRYRIWRLAMCCYGAGGFAGAAAVDLAHDRFGLSVVYLAVGFALSVCAANAHARIEDALGEDDAD
jgi:hypothetical protein